MFDPLACIVRRKVVIDRTGVFISLGKCLDDATEHLYSCLPCSAFRTTFAQLPPVDHVALLAAKLCFGYILPT